MADDTNRLDRMTKHELVDFTVSPQNSHNDKVVHQSSALIGDDQDVLCQNIKKRHLEAAEDGGVDAASQHDRLELLRSGIYLGIASCCLLGAGIHETPVRQGLPGPPWDFTCRNTQRENKVSLAAQPDVFQHGGQLQAHYI